MDIIINDKLCRGAVGDKLSRVALENKAHVGYVCAGLGICQTCYVTVFEGGNCLSPLSDVEMAFLSEKQITEGARLACQATIVEEGTIRILSRPEEVRRMVLSNPFSLFSYSVEMGKSAAERFVPGVTNVIDRIQKGEMQGQGQVALDEALAGMGSALNSGIHAAKESIPFKEQITVMVDFFKQMLPFSYGKAEPGKKHTVERVTVAIGEGNKKKPPAFQALGSDIAGKLEAAGIQNCAGLLERGKSSQGRDKLASETGIPKKQILTLVNFADLCRIEGIGLHYAKLIEAAGVDTVPELAQRNPSHLYDKVQDVNRVQHIVERLPSADDIGKWIAEAKTLPREMTY